MSTNKKPWARRVLAGIGVVALGLAGAAGATSAAFADDESVPDATLVGNIDPDATGSLTVKKYGGLPGDKTNPLSGVEFTVTQVGKKDGAECKPIDLTTNQGWADANTVFEQAPNAPSDPFCLFETGITEKTVKGEIQFTLGVGLYFVEEGDVGDNPVVVKTPSFYVTVPMPARSDTGAAPYWLYNVVAEPKNQVGEAPVKTVNTDGYLVGDEVTWTITGKIPVLAGDDKFTEASMWDALDPRLTYESSKVFVDGIPVPDTVYGFAAGPPATWSFTNLDWLTNNQGKSLSVEIVTTVKEDIGSGEITNTNYGFSFNDKKIPGTVEPYTYVGLLNILKTDDSGRSLEGAEFAVHLAAADDNTCPTSEIGPAVATGKSSNTGQVVWNAPANTPLGLWIADSAGGPLVEPYKFYCVYETKVPAGYVGEGPWRVEIKPGNKNQFELDAVNTQKDGPDLPVTGANGTMLMTIGGLSLIALAGGLYLVNRRKAHQE